MTYRIAEVAELTGVPPSTIRYYEEQGLLRPPDRRPNGYRTYHDRDVARLRFVGRARSLDLPLDDLRELVGLWDDEECAGVADRLRDRVADRLADVQDRIAELMALAAELQQVSTRLEDRPHEGPCHDGCACVDRTPSGTGLPLLPAADDAIVCTLDPAAMPGRATDWEALQARSTGRSPVPGGVSLRFPADPQLAADLVELAAAEHGCCSFFHFSLRITADELHLEVLAPEEAAPVVTAFFGVPGARSAPPTSA